MLLHAQRALDNPSAGQQLGKHENWVRYWRRIWATEGFRLADKPGRGHKPVFPPSGRGHGESVGLRAAPSERGEPLSRYSTTEIARLIRAHPDAPAMRQSIIWRILDRDAIEPRRYRSWIFPRDPQFASTAGRVLDLYAGVWEGVSLDTADCVLSADEKTSTQARICCHASCLSTPDRTNSLASRAA